MQRYTTHDIVDLVRSDTGEIVMHSEAQAEIARLQAERNTAWNAAIEAAEDTAYRWAEKNARNKNTYVDLLDAIRALRKDSK